MQQEIINLYILKEGILDFEKVKKENFLKMALKELKVHIKKGYKIAFMCTEQAPI